MENVSRGLLPDDDKTFSPFWIDRIKAAQAELQFLLDKGYPAKSAAVFVCNHHRLSGRQMLALARGTSVSGEIESRKRKRLLPAALAGRPLYIDGFNLIITLEVALSDGVLVIAGDGCVRDLASLRGSYRIIAHTDTALRLIYATLSGLKVSNVVFFLDRPVSNSGNLKAKIYDMNPCIPTEVEIVRSPDAELKKLPYVVTSDSIILDECESWFNLTPYLLDTCNISGNLHRFINLS